MPTATRPQTLAPLRAIARALSAAWELDPTLDLIVRKTTEVMAVDSCTIYLLDPDGVTLRLRATTGLARRALGRATLKVGEGMTGYAVHSGQPVYAADAPSDPHFKQVEEADEMVFRSLLAVPLIIESRPIGALNVQTVAVRNYPVQEVELLSLIGDLAAGALAKAQLYDNQKRQLEELRALAQVSEAATSPDYLGNVLDLVTGMAARLMNAAVCSIFLLDETGQYLVLHSAQRTTSPYRPRPPLPASEGIIGRVLTTGKPIYVPDVTNDPIYQGGDLARSEGLVSLLSVPLTVRDRVIGVFNCYTAEERIFSEEQRALLMTLANQTALSIENAQLATNAAVVREMNHRIKNNLQTVAMLMRLQLSDLPPAVLDPRQVLEASIHRVHSIAAVHEILSERGFHLVDVKAVLERIMRPISETMTAQPVTIQVEGETFLLPTRAATSLALVVNELVQNALDHAFRKQAAGHVQISLGRSPEELIVLVQDNGVGFPTHSQRGLGLEIVETLVTEDLAGRIKFNRPAVGGTEVSIRIPRTLERDNGAGLTG